MIVNALPFDVISAMWVGRAELDKTCVKDFDIANAAITCVGGLVS